jgi:hypothetical protein
MDGVVEESQNVSADFNDDRRCQRSTIDSQRRWFLPLLSHPLWLQDGVNLLKKRPCDGRTDTHMKTPNIGDSA